MNAELLRFPCFLGRRVHLGVTGSIAAYKSLELLRLLVGAEIGVGVTLTPAAQRFVGVPSFDGLGADFVYTSLFTDQPTGDPFGHLAPGRTAQALCIAPASADILAKLACGLADDMLSTQALAFPGPLILAPAMNPNMWAAAATRANWETLLRRGAVGVGPDSGKVACGDTGAGRLAPVEHIFAAVLRALSPQDMAGSRVLVTLGPTREFWDAVRFLSNPSSGRMGAELALAAWLRGASVHVVAGPTECGFPPGIAVTAVTTAREMYAAAADLWKESDIACCAAAVADFRPVPPECGPDRKLKKRDFASAAPELRLTPNPDILRSLGATKRPEQKLIGFAAETGDPAAEARRKLAEKNADILVANRVDVPGSGFAAATNAVTVLDARGRCETWPQLPKTEVAWRIWDLLLEM